jgi:general secretion pathway protein E
MTATYLANSSAFLVSFYKPLLMFVTFVAWAWLVSSKLDKDARYFRLNPHRYNGIHMAAGLVALALMLAVPIFWIGWPLGIVVLVAPVYAYVQIRNSQVPEDQRFVLTGQTISDRLSKAKMARAAKAASLSFKDPQGKERTAPAKDDPRFAVHMLAEDVIVPALAARATQVDMAVGSQGGTVTQTVDGIRYKREPVPPESAVALVDYVKELACLNVEDRRRRQAADLRMLSAEGRTELSVITAGSSSGQEMRLVFNRAKRLSKPVDDLGLLPSQLEALRVFEEPHERHGVVLFGAPRGHGLTTTGYSLVGRHDAYTSNIKTLELEVLTLLDGVDQVRWDPDNPDVDYAANLQSILRRDPDVVLTAEMRDRETARTAAEPGPEGPLIYIPQRVPSVPEQLQAWAKIVGDLKLAMKPLRAVINQRLLRCVCPNCRQPYQPAADQLQKLNLPADKIKQLYQPSGKIQVKNKIETCPVCGGTGYFGQTGIFQVMMVGDETRRLIMASDLKAAMADARRNKMIFLQEAALRKVVDGETTIDEIVRVTAPPRKAKPRPQADAAPAT